MILDAFNLMPSDCVYEEAPKKEEPKEEAPKKEEPKMVEKHTDSALP